MAFAFEKLVVYQKSVDFADQICSRSENFARGYGFLADQLNRASSSISANIAEGNGRFTSFGTKSKDALAGLVFGKTVTVQSKGTDRYGRTLGVISVGDTNVNQQLVAGGWAWHYKQYSSDQTLARPDPPNDRRCRPLPAMAVTDSTDPSGFATHEGAGYCRPGGN